MALFVALIVSQTVKGQLNEPVGIFAGNHLYVNYFKKDYKVKIETDLGLEIKDARYNEMDSTLRQKGVSKFDSHKINLTGLFKDRKNCKISIDYYDKDSSKNITIVLQKIVYLKTNDLDSLLKIMYDQMHPMFYEKDSAVYITSTVPIKVFFRYRDTKFPSITLSKPVQLAKPIDFLKKEKYLYSIDFGKLNQSTEYLQFSFSYIDVFGQEQYECGCHCEKTLL